MQDQRTPARWSKDGFPICPSCEYDLRGTPQIDGAGRCPECGTDFSKPVSMPKPIPPPTCGFCGYDITGLPMRDQFVICPECGKPNYAHQSATDSA